MNITTVKKLEHKVLVALEEGRLKEEKAIQLFLDMDPIVTIWDKGERRHEKRMRKIEALKAINQL